MAKVLIIDDDPSLLRLYQKVFTLEGHEVVLASEGSEAINIVRTIHPDIILLDIMMPTMNGIDVLKILKSDTVLSHIPVVILTNLSSSQDSQKALSLGALKCVIKSEMDPQQVVAVAKEILDGKVSKVSKVSNVSKAL